MRDPAYFQDWVNPGLNKFIPGTARNCPGVVTPLRTKSVRLWTREYCETEQETKNIFYINNNSVYWTKIAK